MFTQSDPFRDFDAMFNRFARANSTTAGATDAYRRGDDVWVHIDVPGVTPESIDVTVERGVLTVSAERPQVRQQGDRMYLAERPSGAFRRQMHLGDGLDVSTIEADYHDGVLTLRIPVAKEAKPQKITVGRKNAAIESNVLR